MRVDVSTATAPRVSAKAGAGARRVAFLLPGFHGGGAERITIQVAAELQSLGRNVDLVVGTAKGPLASTVPPDLPVVDLGADRMHRAILPLARYLRSSMPDVLLPTIGHADRAGLVAAYLARSGTSTIPRVSNTLSQMRPPVGRPLPRASHEVLKLLYRRAPVVVACSQGMADDLAAYVGVDPSRIRVIPNAVVGPRLHDLASVPVAEPAIEGSGPLIVTVASLTRQKNLPLLLDAFARVRRRRPARLLILGDGPLRASLERLTAQLGMGDSVRFAGFDPNPYRYIARSDLFVLSSDWEGLPGVLIEALACGANIVATDCPSGPREILAGGRFGRLVPRGQPDALAHAMSAALAQPMQPPEASWQPYTAAASARAYAELVEEAVDGRASRGGS